MAQESRSFLLARLNSLKEILMKRKSMKNLLVAAGSLAIADIASGKYHMDVDLENKMDIFDTYQENPFSTNDFSKVLSRLACDWDFIQDFLNDPEITLRDYRLTEEQGNALKARDVDSLMRLGISEECALEVVSGLHTHTCGGSNSGLSFDQP